LGIVYFIESQLFLFRGKLWEESEQFVPFRGELNTAISLIHLLQASFL